MSTDFTKIALTSGASSLKVWKQGTGSFVVPGLPGQGDTYGSATIAHGYGSDDLLFQVAMNGGENNGTIIPWESNDGRQIQYANIDGTNLNIYCISSNSGTGPVASITITYFYRILIP